MVPIIEFDMGLLFSGCDRKGSANDTNKNSVYGVLSRQGLIFMSSKCQYHNGKLCLIGPLKLDVEDRANQGYVC